MKIIYHYTENIFERIASVTTAILGNSITFLIAFGLVLYWWSDIFLNSEDSHRAIEDVILGITFRSLFIIQKSFNRFSGALHLKVNELVSSHENANNAVINSEVKTEREINELSKEYEELAATRNEEESI